MPIIVKNNGYVLKPNKYTPDQHRYKMSDLSSVYTHYDPKTGKNVPTENRLNVKGD